MKLIRFVSVMCLSASLFAASPAEMAIRQANANIEKQPGHYPYYNDLAAAYAGRARETADVRWYERAEEAAQKSLTLSPGNFDAQKVLVQIQLGRHQYTDALEAATKLNKAVPDDISVYGFLVDADLELGYYDEAVPPAQWMLNLREGSGPGLSRAAAIRELHGNLPGALDLLQKAIDAAPEAETEEGARMLAQKAHVELIGGDTAAADSDCDAALRALPGFDPALAVLARVRVAQVRYADAVNLQRKRYDSAPRLDVLYALAEAQEQAGQHDEASESFRQFAHDAESSSIPELVFYFADHAGDPAKALEVAKREIAQRHDIFTRDAYAWALNAGGDSAAANAEMKKLADLGTKEPVIRYHATVIGLQMQSRAAGQ